jgi:uncharacterized protein involved in tolerance to divalent cations
MYWWNDEICKVSESLILIKTVQSNFQKIIKTVKEHHDYDIPEVAIIFIKIY